MAERHVSVPKQFASGDANEWFKRFDICSRANGWNDAAKALKLPTLLEGEALAIWLEISEDIQGSYEDTQAEIKRKMMPMGFVSLDEFHNRKLLPGEALSVFVHSLKTLLLQAMPDIDADARDQLLPYQFLAGIPASVSRQLRATGVTKALAETVERTRLLMMIDSQDRSAPLMSTEKTSEISALREQVAMLTEQVAALSTAPRRSAGDLSQEFWSGRKFGPRTISQGFWSGGPYFPI